jgi:hypothetical protein
MIEEFGRVPSLSIKVDYNYIHLPPDVAHRKARDLTLEGSIEDYCE